MAANTMIRSIGRRKRDCHPSLIMKIKARWNIPPLPRKTFDAALFMIAVIMRRSMLVSAVADTLGSYFGNCLTSNLCLMLKNLSCIDSSGAVDSSRSKK